MLSRSFSFTLLILFLRATSASQGFTFVPDDTVLSGPLGSEIVFNVTITNVSQLTMTLALVRAANNLPPAWESSMCLSVCFPSTVDSILTSPEFGSTPLSPGESRPFSLHVYTTTNYGTGTIRIVVRDTRNPSDQRVTTFTASAIEAGVTARDGKAGVYSLSECYPNPFNPGTTIRYAVPEQSLVTLRVFNVLGQEVATLASNRQQSGSFEVRWDARDAQGIPLPGGVYFCTIDARSSEGNGHFTGVRKLLLLR